MPAPAGQRRDRPPSRRRVVAVKEGLASLAAPMPAGRTPERRAWLPPRQTPLAADAVRFSIAMRWLVLLAGPLIILLNPIGWPWPGVLLLLALLTNALLTLARRAGEHPSLFLAAALDVAIIT